MSVFWLIIWLICGIWGAMDASDRGQSGILVFILILFLGPIGLIIWLLIRDKGDR